MIIQVTSKVLTATPEAAPYLAGMEPGLMQALEKLAHILQATVRGS